MKRGPKKSIPLSHPWRKTNKPLVKSAGETDYNEVRFKNTVYTNIYGKTSAKVK